MRGFFLVLLAGLPMTVASQCVNSSSAENTQNGVSMSHIIGQTVAAESDNGMLSAGVVSSYQISALTGNELIGVSLVAVYPNPTSDILVLNTGDLTDASYRIIDMEGKTISTGKANDGETKIDFSTLPIGVYHLSVYSKESAQKTFRIIKK